MSPAKLTLENHMTKFQKTKQHTTHNLLKSSNVSDLIGVKFIAILGHMWITGWTKRPEQL